MQVDIYSDIACPWCYVGERRFARALAAWKGADVHVTFRPYQLAPDLPHDPAESQPAPAYYAARFGPRFRDMQAQLAGVAAAEGIDYRGDAIRVTNTFDAHRLMRLALHDAGEAGQKKVAEGLFRAYFTEGRVVSDPETLVAVATEAGLDPARVREMLGSDAGAAEVRADLAEAQALGVTAVPTFVFDGRLAVQGAQAVEVFLEVLERAAAA